MDIQLITLHLMQTLPYLFYEFFFNFTGSSLTEHAQAFKTWIANISDCVWFKMRYNEISLFL